MESTLYKRSKTGKLLEWTLCWDEKSYWTISGEVGGKLTTSAPTFCEAKNVGRSNETSIKQQVELEVKSKIQHALEHGYYKTPDEIPDSKFEVSLAEKYQDRLEKGKVDFPYIVQPKLDGIRCYIKKDDDGVIRARSRAHKEFVSIPHITGDKLISDIINQYPGIILDGELYNHVLKKDFNKIVSLVRKTKPTENDIKESKDLILFNMFDCYIPNKTYVERNSEVVSFMTEQTIPVLDETPLRVVNSFGIWNLAFSIKKNYHHEVLYAVQIVSTPEEIESKIEEYIANDYEGIMLKKDVEYVFGRSTSLLKYKRFRDAEYKIIDIEDGKGNKAGIGVSVVCESGNTVFRAGINGTEDYARELFEHKEKYIGKSCTVKYQELTPIKSDGTGGVPRFGKMTSIRDYE